MWVDIKNLWNCALGKNNSCLTRNHNIFYNLYEHFRHRLTSQGALKALLTGSRDRVERCWNLFIYNLSQGETSSDLRTCPINFDKV